MISHRCRKCLWWDNQHQRVQAESAGFCRKHKPGGEKREGRIWGIWPLTDQDDFCGEFREDKPNKKSNSQRSVGGGAIVRG